MSRGRVIVLSIKPSEGEFTISLLVLDRGFLIDNARVGKLNTLTDLFDIYQGWHELYVGLIGYPLSGGIALDESIATHEGNTSGVDACRRLSKQLGQGMRNMLSNHQDPGWKDIREQVLKQLHNNESDEIRVVIQTDDPQVWKLPWHECDLLQDDYVRRRGVEVAFSALHHSKSYSNPVTPRGRVKIVALVDNIPNFQQEDNIPNLKQTVQTTIQSLPNVIPEYPDNLNQLLFELKRGCDIVVFAGHGATRSDGSGWIIYGNSQIPVESFADALRDAVSKGLKLLFLCCCDNLGLVKDLKDAGVNIPAIVAMRAEISVLAAQEFFANFFQNYAQEKQPLYQSFRQAREALQNWEQQLPGTRRIPMLYQIISVTPPSWQELIESGLDVPPPPPPPPPPQPPQPDPPPRRRESVFQQCMSLVSQFVQRRLVRLLMGMLVGFVVYLAIWYLFNPPSPEVALCPSGLPANVSFGDKLLNNSDNNPAVDTKAQTGIKNLKDACTKFGNGSDENTVAAAVSLFKQAANDLTAAHEKNTKNAEILTYKNNAEVYLKYAKAARAQPDQKLVRPNIIAVAIPLNPDGNRKEINNQANEINLGVAIAQQELNNSLNQKNKQELIVLIVDDKNQRSTVEPLINNLKKVKLGILGVVGHALSELTLKVSDLYNDNKLVLISPTSTAVDIRPVNSIDSNYIFRVCPTDKSTAKTISDYINTKISKVGTVIVPYVDDEYGRSLSKKVHGFLSPKWTVNLIRINSHINNIMLKDAVALVLIPNAATRESALNWFDAANKHSLSVIAGDSMYSGATIDTSTGGSCPEGLVVAAPAYNSDFVKKVDDVLKNKYGEIYGKIESWRVPYSYSAAFALIEASTQAQSPLNSSKIRDYLLHTPNITDAATGLIKFDQIGDRVEQDIQLFHVVKNGNQCTFQPCNSFDCTNKES